MSQMSTKNIYLRNFSKKNVLRNFFFSNSLISLSKFRFSKFYCSIVLLFHGQRPKNLYLRNVSKKNFKFFFKFSIFDFQISNGPNRLYLKIFWFSFSNFLISIFKVHVHCIVLYCIVLSWTPVQVLGSCVGAPEPQVCPHYTPDERRQCQAKQLPFHTKWM